MVGSNHCDVSSQSSHCFNSLIALFFSCFYGCDFCALSLLLLLDACDRKQKPPASLVWAREAGGFICYVSSVSGDYNLYPHWSNANDQFFSTNSTVSGLYWYLFFLYPFFLFT